MVANARLGILLPLFLAHVALAETEVYLSGDTCPIAIEVDAVADNSASTKPSLVDISGLGSVFFLQGRLKGFIAEKVEVGEAPRPTCEVTLENIGSGRNVAIRKVAQSDLLPVVWREVGTEEGNGGYVVEAGHYRFRFTFLLADPGKQPGKEIIWTVRSPVFFIKESQGWTRFE